jgi:hypothetical protein
MAVLLSRSHILSTKLPHEDVEVPEWGGFVRIQAMDLRTRQRFIGLVAQAETDGAAYEADPDNVLKPLLGRGDEPIIGLLLCLVDEDGNPMFQMSDVDEIRNLSSAALSHLYMRFIGLNQFGSVGDHPVEAEKKDSEETTSDSSPSD